MVLAANRAGALIAGGSDSIALWQPGGGAPVTLLEGARARRAIPVGGAFLAVVDRTDGARILRLAPGVAEEVWQGDAIIGIETLEGTPVFWTASSIWAVSEDLTPLVIWRSEGLGTSFAKDAGTLTVSDCTLGLGCGLVEVRPSSGAAPAEASALSGRIPLRPLGPRRSPRLAQPRGQAPGEPRCSRWCGGAARGAYGRLGGHRGRGRVDRRRWHGALRRR